MDDGVVLNRPFYELASSTRMVARLPLSWPRARAGFGPPSTARTYSLDLRDRVVELVAVGQTCRASVDVQCRQCGMERQRFRPEASPLSNRWADIGCICVSAPLRPFQRPRAPIANSGYASAW